MTPLATGFFDGASRQPFFQALLGEMGLGDSTSKMTEQEEMWWSVGSGGMADQNETQDREHESTVGGGSRTDRI